MVESTHLVATQERGQVMIGNTNYNMCHYFSANGDNYNNYRNEFFAYNYDADQWDLNSYLANGKERHTCGIIKRISDDHKLLFMTGGALFWHDSRGRLSSSYDNYHGAQYDLTNYPSGSWNYTMAGTIREENVKFASISPYEGYIFKWGGGDDRWWIWDELRQDFRMTTSKYPRDSTRYEFSAASIPKSSPMVKNCL